MHLFAWSPNPYAPKSYRRGPMVTPVHGFQRIESTFINHRGRFDGHGHRGRRWSNRPRVARTFEQDPSQPHIQARASEVTRPPEVLVENGGTPEEPASTRRPTLPDNFNRFKMRGINWSMWTCLIIVTGFLIPAHLYLKTHSYRGEIMVVLFICTLMFLMCFSVSMFHTKTRDILLHRLRMEEDREGALPETPTVSSRNSFRSVGASSHDMHTSATRSVRGSRSSPELNEVITGAGQRRGVLRPMSQASRASAYIGMLPSTEPCGSQQMSGPIGEPPPYEVALLLPVPSMPEPERCPETPPPPYDVIH